MSVTLNLSSKAERVIISSQPRHSYRLLQSESTDIRPSIMTGSECQYQHDQLVRSKDWPERPSWAQSISWSGVKLLSELAPESHLDGVKANL